VTAETERLRAELAARDATIAELERERDEARKNYQWMVEHAADNKLDGYRELGQRVANAERERDQARAELAARDASIARLQPVVSAAKTYVAIREDDTVDECPEMELYDAELALITSVIALAEQPSPTLDPRDATIARLKRLIEMQLDYTFDLPWPMFRQKYGEVTREQMYEDFRMAVNATLAECPDGCSCEFRAAPLIGCRCACHDTPKAPERGAAERAIDSPTWPYVYRFALAMESKLAQNRHKGDRDGWLHDGGLSLLARLREETDELEQAIRQPMTERSDTELLGESADVANFAMMVADVMTSGRVLDVVRAPEAERAAGES